MVNLGGQWCSPFKGYRRTRGKRSMKIVIDEHRCKGHGRCYAIAPEVFAPVDDDGHSGALLDELSANDADLTAKVAEASANCPEYAIAVDQSESVG